MTANTPPPTTQPAFDDPTNPVFNILWLLFFNQLYQGDQGQEWSPLISDLTVAGGTPIIEGAVYQLSTTICVFFITITPASGGSTTCTAGTTRITNFPLEFQNNGACWAVSGLLGTNAGMCNQLDNNIYPPSWNAVTVPLTIVGFGPAS